MGNQLNVDWNAIQHEYEQTNATHLSLATKHGISQNTIARRCQIYAWRKPGDKAKDVVRAAQRISTAAEHAILDTCAQVAAQVRADTAATLKELQPWIEQMRAEHVKYIVGLSRKALSRVDDIFDSQAPKEPKHEQFSAAAIEKHDLIIRRNLGMQDGQTSNSLNLNVLVAGGRSVHDRQENPAQANVVSP